jgi:plastocyanin
MVRARLFGGIVVAALVLASACGSGTPGGSANRSENSRTTAGSVASPSGSPSTAAASGTKGQTTSASPKPVDPRERGFTVGFGEWAVTPETTSIRPGRITFVARNGGRLHHGFELRGEGSHRHGGGFKLEGPLFGPGDHVRLSATLSPGVYELECYVGDHEERGMRSTLVVRADAPLVRPAAPKANEVKIDGFAFGPSKLSVSAGTQVRWANGDPTAHTVTAVDGSFGSDPLSRGQAFTRRFDAAGVYRYRCAIHPTMEGTVVVTR